MNEETFIAEMISVFDCNAAFTKYMDLIIGRLNGEAKRLSNLSLKDSQDIFRGLVNLYNDTYTFQTEFENKYVIGFDKTTISVTPEFIQTELIFLRDKFGDDNVVFVLDKYNQSWIQVTTPDIVIDYKDQHVEFGPFQIKILVESIKPDGYLNQVDLQVIALKPNRPFQKETVTHPHIDNNYPCWGDIQTATKTCLQRCMLGEVFTLIYQLLVVYNNKSPHVKITEWAARECMECGDNFAAAELSKCYQCDSNLCALCKIICGYSGRFFCTKCSYFSDVNNCYYAKQFQQELAKMASTNKSFILTADGKLNYCGI